MDRQKNNLLYANFVLLILAGIKLGLHFYVNLHDNIFRDEFYYLACARNLDFGYVDHPPMVAIFTAISYYLIGDSLFSIRLLPALTGAATVFLTGYLARILGGEIYAQTLAGISVVISPLYLGIHGLLSMNVYDHLFWLIGFILIVKIIKTENSHLWPWLGLVMGIGLLNKVSILFFGFGLFVGIVLSQHRRWLLSVWTWIGGLLAFTIFSPHIIWQMINDWPTVEFMRNASLYKNMPLTPVKFMLAQMMEMHPFLLPVWLSGLGWFFFSSKGTQYRLLGWMYLATLFLLVTLKGKSYYMAPAYFSLLASGSVAVESGMRRLKWKGIKSSIIVILSLGGAMTAPMAVPILSPEQYIQYSQMLGVEISSGEKGETGSLPQHFADRHGWEEMAKTVSEVYQSLMPEMRKRCVIFAKNYGEAGAMEYYASKFGLPPIFSGHNSYFMWGLGEEKPEVVIVIGSGREEIEKYFHNVNQATIHKHPLSRPNESFLPIFVAKDLKKPWKEIWPEVKNYI